MKYEQKKAIVVYAYNKSCENTVIRPQDHQTHVKDCQYILTINKHVYLLHSFSSFA